jgi:drug/metabolite transporter (DMT)-like permease
MTMQTHQQMKAADWALIGILSILWGGSFFFIKIGVSVLPPLTVVLARVGLAAVTLLVVVRIVGLSMREHCSKWLAFFGMGVLNNLIPFSLIFWAQQHIPSGLASILNATTPLFAVIAAHMLLQDEKLTGPRVAGVLAGLAGVGIMMGPDLLLGAGQTTLAAQLACLGAAVSYACAGIFGRRFAGVPPLVTAAGQVSATTLMMLPLVLILDKPWLLPIPPMPVIGALVGLAMLSTALAYVIFFRILRSAGPTNLSLVTLLIPVVAILLGTVLLGETLLTQHLIGMGLIGLGLMLIDGRVVRALQRERTHS